jgi:glucose-6-phosphate isomerase
VHAALDRSGFANRRAARWKNTPAAHQGVVNIGIGGSDLGPVMARRSVAQRSVDDVPLRV